MDLKDEARKGKNCKVDQTYLDIAKPLYNSQRYNAVY